MSIQAILYRKGSSVVTIGADATLKHAAEKLRERNIAALVVKNGDSVVGIISEREIVHALARHGAEAVAMSVGDILVRKPIVVAAGDSLKRAMALMTRNRTRHLLVQRNGELAGIVSIGDVIKHRLEDLELETNFFEARPFAHVESVNQRESRECRHVQS